MANPSRTARDKLVAPGSSFPRVPRGLGFWISNWTLSKCTLGHAWIMSTPPASPPAIQEHDVPTIPSLEPKRRWLEPIDDTIMYGEPIHIQTGGASYDWDWYPGLIRSWVRQKRVPSPYFGASSSLAPPLPLLPCTMEQAFTSFMATMDREIRNMRDAAGEISGLLEREKQENERIELLKAELAVTDHYHNELVDTFHQLRAQVDTLEATNDVSIGRTVQLEVQLEGALEAADALDSETEDEPAEEEEDAETMAGRGRDSRGNISMSAAELTALINNSVAEAVGPSGVEDRHMKVGLQVGPGVEYP
ncbi:hypothetical protein L1987_20296 [Smallanthus sonchifolius]|uniref:Uncharacterized protein n=1 Tax=Smallanthus sonchifolius TaxID=185202 RepID=A0ACB9IRN5_9ASTR|nr:hypothetical protein L1987_20296 [Smallanthus sonchifolius]